MAALTEPRNTKITKGVVRSFPLAAVKALAGGIAVMNSSGFAEPATAATGKKVLGMFEETVDNTGGAAGALSVKVRNAPDEAYLFADGAAPGAATNANIGDTVYAADDQTVVLDSTGRSAVGVIDEIATDGLRIRFS